MERGTVTEFFGLLGAIVIVAALSVSVVNGGKTAQVINAFGGQFTAAIRAATLQPGTAAGRTIAR